MRRALVTGGSSGIGLAIAQTLAGAGIDVTIAARDGARLKEAGFPSFEIDVTDEKSVSEGIAKAAPLDILIVCAGGAETAPALETPRALWDRMLALNLTSAYVCAHEALPPMVERGWGRFIVVASTASLRGYAYASAYAAAKHGALGFVRSLALELAKTGVTANAICPGYTDTPLVTKALDTIVAKTGRSRTDAVAALVRKNPMGRLIEPDEVAETALWLCGESAGAVNGQAIAIDGGETA